MGIMVSSTTRVLCFATPGPAGGADCAACVSRMRRAGTTVVGVVQADGGATSIGDLVVFDTAEQAVRETAANAALVSVLADGAADAMMEAIDAGLSLVLCRTKAVPARDMVKVINYLQGSAGLGGPRHNEGRIWLLGPGSSGAITPGAGMVGALDPGLFRPGRVAVVSQSGCLAEAAAAQLTARGIGQSTCLVTSAALIVPTRLADVLGMLEADPDTEVIVLIGGIGGRAELEAAAFIREAVSKPTIAYLPGRSAPPGVNLGAEGDFASARPDETEEKAEALRKAGALVVPSLDDITPAVAERM